MRTLLTFPFPPSVNSLYDGGKNTKRRFTSERYARWIEDAGWHLLSQRDRNNRHTGPVEVVYTLCPPDKRRRDVFNYEKAISDLLVKHGILSDDVLIQKGTVQWLAGPPVTVLIIDVQSEIHS